MKNLSIKLFSMLVIMLLCLSPLGAIDLNQGDNTPIINGTDTKNDNNIADVNDTINNNIKDNNSNVEIKSINETENFKNKEESKNLSLNDTNTSKNLTTLQDNAPGTFADLQTEINNAPAGSVLHLTRDYNGAENTVVKLDKDLTIDGNGHTIDCKRLENCEAFTSTSGRDTIIHITSKDIKYGEEETIGFALADIDGNNISGSIDVSVANNSQTVNIVDGVGTLKVRNLSAGHYTVIAKYAGSEKYLPSYSLSDFNVVELGTQIICKDMTTKAVGSTDGKVGEYFNWTLVDENGKPMKNVPMKIGFNGVVYDEKNGIVTDDNGNAKIQINLGYKGTYTYAIFYPGDNNHNSSFTVSKITVEEQTPILTVPNKSYKTTEKNKQLTATFKTSRGNPIPSKKITFTVNGKSYTATTNNNGIATVNIDLNTKGTYSFTTEFSGDNTYKTTSQTAKLTIQ